MRAARAAGTCSRAARPVRSDLAVEAAEGDERDDRQQQRSRISEAIRHSIELLHRMAFFSRSVNHPTDTALMSRHGPDKRMPGACSSAGMARQKLQPSWSCRLSLRSMSPWQSVQDRQISYSDISFL